MRQLLVNPKDKTDKWKKTGTIYHITCQDCEAVYIGETGRALETRVQEHQKITSSAVHEHCTDKQHSMDWNNIKILDREQHPIRRKIKEAIHIHRATPSINRDQGMDLPPVYKHLLSHDLTTGGHVTN